MKGLWMKEVILLKTTIRMQGVILLIFAAMGIALKNLAYLAMMVMVMTGNVCVNSLTYDAMASWNSYAATFPLRRSSLISAKYVLLYVLVSGAAVMMLLVGIPFSQFAGITYGECAGTVAACWGMGLFSGSLNLLLCTKFGVKKAQTLAMLSFLAPFGCVMLLYYLTQKGIIDLGHVTERQLYLVIAGLAAATVACSLFFWRLSCRIFQKQDLT